MKIACAGDNCVDYYDETGDAYYGGNPVNVAVYFKRLGGESAYIGAVGNDEHGPKMKAAIEAKGVDCSHLRIEEGSTALTHVTMENGDRVLGDYDEGVMEHFSLSEEDIAFIEDYDLVISGLWSRTSDKLKRFDNKVMVAFDFAERPYDPAGLEAMPSVNIGFFSDDNLEDEALKAKMRDIASRGPQIVVATRGDRGSVALCEGKFYEYGIKKCEVVDTMGAGDSYIAGFLYEYLYALKCEPGLAANLDEFIPACMKAGAENAAITIGYSGAW